MNQISSDTAALLAQDIDTQQLRARVAWLYFVGGLTQQDIADQLSLTRLRVNKILGQVRSEGSVVVDIRLPLADCVELEQRLMSRFGLKSACVVPTLTDEDDLQRVIGDAAGSLLERVLQDGMGLGVGWGKTLTAGLRRLNAQHFTRSWVTSLMGGLTRGSGSSTFEVATGYARAMSAECYYLTVPLYFPTPESRESLLAHYGISETLRRARSVDVALISCGDMTTRSQLIRTQTVEENLPSLLAAGAVGDLLGVFLDQHGRPVDHPLNERVLCLTPTELKSVSTSILASGGLNKVPIIGAVLEAGYVTSLTTDQNCATALLAR